MKRLYYLSLVIISVVILSMCTKSSTVEEEKEFANTVLESEKATVDPSKMETEVLDLINNYRQSIGASTLTSNATSYKYAEDHNSYMISKNSLSHDNFESRASSIALEINAVDIGENVARFYTTAETVVEGWLESASHKKTIEGDYTHTTLSVLLDKEGRPYFTQIFMRVE